ncbi:histidine phosphatase family protein [Flavobacterium agricola]|uniref:Histidine phosphatase family protein n=1 Tax=Flavobacterium agricola TaxID=2870839 RepID=A0ABY6M0Z4_9FLAO|nr:histidine phosphatase family protein [Flavobacterium agricola]UYW02223.1 histidine phosphatase family protein [Flavobacterium agricola]
MKKIILIRHGKSDWKKMTSDLERPLSSRGIRDVFKVSEFITDYLPEKFVVWSSVAKRAKDTALIFAQNLSIPLETIIFKNELYTFEAENLEHCIKNCDDKYSNLILFGHNDAILDFVNKFTGNTLINVPTSSYISIAFPDSSWKSIDNGTLEHAIFPKQLKNERITT